MRIIIQPPNNSSEGFAALSREIRKAIEVLRAAYIPTEGGGTVGTDGNAFGALILRYDDDAPRAIAALTDAGIRASTK